jgi:hypothetical protein
VKKFSKIKRFVRIGLFLGILFGMVASPLSMDLASADSCTPPTTTYGTDTMSVNIATAGTYSIWTRVETPSSSVNSILLNIDNSTCFNVGGSSLTANTWTWVNYADGNTATKVTANLSAGTHTFTLTGTESGLMVDRIEALADNTCVPTGTGDNCTVSQPVDTTPPTVSLTSTPAAVTSSTSATIDFTGTDNVTATSSLTYECSLDGAAYSSCTSPDSLTGLANGSHSFAVKSEDQAGNLSTAATTSWTVDTVAPTVSLTTPAANATVSGTVNVAANAADNVAVASVQFKLDGVNLGTADTSSPYSYSWDTTGTSNGSHTLTAVATDTTGHTTTSSSVAVTVSNSSGGDTTAPSVPTSLVQDTTIPVTATSIDMKWNASTDNSGGSGLAGYKLYRNGTLIATLGSTTTSYMDYGLAANTSYIYTVAAFDNSGNNSAATTGVTVKTTTLVGDLDGDGHVTGHDLSVLLAHYNTAYPQGEFDGFSLVEGHDLSLLLTNYGK